MSINNMEVSNLYSNIQALCKREGISITEFEQAVDGIGVGTVYKWKAVTPSVSKVKAAADYFGITVDALLTGELTDAGGNDDD